MPPGVLGGLGTAGRCGSQEPSLVTPGPLHAFVLCFTIHPLTSLPAALPFSLCSIPFGSPHFSLEWVFYPRLCSGLTQLNTNKTHSTQVEQGARASVTNDSPALAKRSCKSLSRCPGLGLLSAALSGDQAGCRPDIWLAPKAFPRVSGQSGAAGWEGRNC